MTQVIPALPGAIVGLPLGIGLYKVAARHGVSGLPPVLWMVAAVLGTVLVVAALTSVPARIGLRRPLLRCFRPRRRDASRLAAAGDYHRRGPGSAAPNTSATLREAH
jgi:hypothetical protein